MAKNGFEVPEKHKIKHCLNPNTKSHLSDQNFKGDYDTWVNYLTHNGSKLEIIVCLLQRRQILAI